MSNNNNKNNRESQAFIIEPKKNKNGNNYGSSSETSLLPNQEQMPNTSTPTARETPIVAMTPDNAEIMPPSSRSTLRARALSETRSTYYCVHKKGNIDITDHCHRERPEGVDVKARKKLIIASILCVIFMIAEIIGGVLSNSLAIATDAAHLLTDFASFMISLFAIWMAGRPSTQRMSFGWYRAEVIGALASVFMIWIITGILVYMAILRVIHQDFEVEATIMLITSGFAILVNLIMGCQLHHGHSHGGAIPERQPIPDPTGISTWKDKNKSRKSPILGGTDKTACEVNNTACPDSPTGRLENGAQNLNDIEAGVTSDNLENYSYQNSPGADNRTDLATTSAVKAETHRGGLHHTSIDGKKRQETENLNVRAAFIHVIGDMVQSVGVFIAALIIFFRPDWAIADPICTFIFSIIVLITTFAIMKDALLVLMEGTPSFMEYNEVLETFLAIPGVERVHNLRIWALSINKVSLSAHLAVAPGSDQQAILAAATEAVHRRYNFFETTLQIEEVTPNMENCEQCVVPEE